MSRLTKKAKSSKLKGGIRNESHATASKERVIKKLKAKDYPRSYRIDADVMNVLRGTLDRVNEAASRKVSEARLVKALFVLSREIKEDKIIKALKEVW